MLANKSQLGQSLWEVIVALAIAGLIALGLVRATSSAVKSSRFSKDQSKATSLAQAKTGEIIEYKNSNSASFWENVGNSPEEWVYSEDINPPFCTLATVHLDSLPTATPDYAQSKMARILVTVYWDQKGEDSSCEAGNYDYSISLETYVTN